MVDSSAEHSAAPDAECSLVAKAKFVHLVEFMFEEIFALGPVPRVTKSQKTFGLKKVIEVGIIKILHRAEAKKIRVCHERSDPQLRLGKEILQEVVVLRELRLVKD